MALWENKGLYIQAEFRFSNFQEALKFVNKVGTIAEIQGHHPDIKLYKYNQVSIRSTTHSAGNTVTDLDWRLAESIDKVNS